jgi:dienelactone hydrolase
MSRPVSPSISWSTMPPTALATTGVSFSIASATVSPNPSARDARHAFLNDHDQADVPRWAILTRKLSHSEYDEPSAADARRRMVAFFHRHLRGGDARR